MRVLAYDATKVALFNVGTTWKIGAVLFRPFFDAVIPATSWDQLLEGCADLGDDLEVHFWGHGMPGWPILGGELCPVRDERWKCVSLLWLRCCSTMHGPQGAAMVRYFHQHGTAVVGHLNVIGPWGHSYLVGCAPGQDPWWRYDVDPSSWGRPWSPRTVHVTTQRLPHWWDHPVHHLGEHYEP